MRGFRAILVLGLGIILGLIFSPNTGRANRAKVKDKINHYTSLASNFVIQGIPAKARYYGGKLLGVRHDVAKAFSPQGSEKFLVDDATITAKIKSLMGRPRERINHSGVNINTENGVVHIRGYVRSLREKQRIERIARNIPESIDVVNELRIAA